MRSGSEDSAGSIVMMSAVAELDFTVHLQALSKSLCARRHLRGNEDV